MSDWKEPRTLRMEAQRRLAADSLKCCPLCGAVNAMTNEECFVCRWHGEFDHDPYRVEEGLGELLMQCPELVDAMMDVTPPRLNRMERLRAWFRGLFRRRVDLRV
jgi:hypothetical protein